MKFYRFKTLIQWPVFIAIISVAVMAVSLSTSDAMPDPEAQVSHASLPLYFEANQGQTHPQVQFLSRGLGYTAFVTPTEMVLRLPAATGPQAHGSAVLRLQWLGANPAPRLSGLERQASRSHYFIGRDPQQWRRGVAHYAKVYYTGLYPDVDLVLYGNQQQLAYDLILAPEADASRITLGFQGAQAITIDAHGDLLISLAGRALRMRKPFVYQDLPGERRAIPSQYILRGPNQVGFRVAAYDRTRPLVIDPVLSYSTFLGGGGTRYRARHRGRHDRSCLYHWAHDLGGLPNHREPVARGI